MPATRILLVDDVPMFRDLGSVFLSRSGPVDLADSASAAFQCADERKPTIVIADMHLPDMGGFEFCRRMKTHPGWGNPRVILLARPDSPDDHADGVRAGADEVLFKPLERDALIASVRRLTDFPTPRGLPRALIERPIEITARGRRISGILRNVSRGGIFVDAPIHFNRSEEVSLRFDLGDQDLTVSPTAQVVWTDRARNGFDRVGMRFLKIDARTVNRLEHYVSDHYPRNRSVPA
ncbi:MAG TPA: response regulator [Deltaproteobacteria bacterium]|nr:response regulator [Deltaproteobacteria bacterium]